MSSTRAAARNLSAWRRYSPERGFNAPSPGGRFCLRRQGWVGGERGQHRPLERLGVGLAALGLPDAGGQAAVAGHRLARRGDDPQIGLTEPSDDGRGAAGAGRRDAVAVALERHQRRPRGLALDADLQLRRVDGQPVRAGNDDCRHPVGPPGPWGAAKRDQHPVDRLGQVAEAHPSQNTARKRPE